MERKYNVGDRFVRKNTRDTIPVEIIRIMYSGFDEPDYELKPIRFGGNHIIVGEEALDAFFDKIDK